MFLLTLKDQGSDGAYAIQNRYGEKVLMMFQKEDDAERYAMPVSYTHLTLPTTPYV